MRKTVYQDAFRGKAHWCLPPSRPRARIEYQNHVATPTATTYNFGVNVVQPNISAIDVLGRECTTMSFDTVSLQICKFHGGSGAGGGEAIHV